MRVQLPGGFQADRVTVSGSAMICICGQITHVYHIGKHQITLYGTFTRLAGKGDVHIHAIDEQYICVWQDGLWVFHEFTEGLPVSHSCKVLGFDDTDDGKPLSKAVLNNTRDCYIVGVGGHTSCKCQHDTPCDSPNSLDVYLYRMSTRTIFAQVVTSSGSLIDYDDSGNLLYFDNATGMPTLWRYRASPMPIDVCNMLVKSSDPKDNLSDYVNFTCRSHGQQLRFIMASGYRGAVEINMLTRVCQTVWTHQHVTDIITAEKISECVTHDIRTGRYWQDDRDCTQEIAQAIGIATKNEPGVVRASISMPEHVIAQDTKGGLSLVKLVGL